MMASMTVMTAMTRLIVLVIPHVQWYVGTGRRPYGKKQPFCGIS